MCFHGGEGLEEEETEEDLEWDGMVKVKIMDCEKAMVGLVKSETKVQKGKASRVKTRWLWIRKGMVLDNTLALRFHATAMEVR